MERRKLHNLCVFSKQYLEAGTLAVRKAYSQVMLVMLMRRSTWPDPQFSALRYAHILKDAGRSRTH